MKYERGFGLTEAMITVLLASLIIIILLQHYLNCKKFYLGAQISLEREFELQLVSDLIRDSVRRAGFTPCVNVNHLQSIDRRNNRTHLVAFERDAGKNHALQLNRMSEYFNPVLQIITPSRLLVPAGQAYTTKHPVLLADCYHAEVQQILSLRPTLKGVEMIFPHPFIFHYVEPIYVGEWVEEAFFIQQNRQKKWALFYRYKHAEELTSAINKLTADIHFLQEKTVLTVNLGLDDMQNLTIETTVRTP
ncbi:MULTISPECIES: hypothetical protein [unclassified Legionella]|uniref:hypothetical protein n=1 Tax=unclassified Legionella TaxID=2622702 RepID=UPI001E43C91F|nr:hypothetical protein [Legionella sp. 31fI33]MCC5013914.1 hypothetical protein [Legionella sp. 31fI33]